MEYLKQILLDQKEEIELFKKKKNLIKREIYENVKDFLDTNLIKIIIGVRRAGKSTFAMQLLKNKNFAYVNFDDERLIDINKKDLNLILEIIHEIYGDIKYLFFDEIQNIEGWELFVNRLQRKNYNIIITGSNANLLSKELSTHLTGRHIAIELFPFSFKEYLNYYKQNNEIKTTKEIALIKKHLEKYLLIGGFPETYELPNSRIYLRNLYSNIISKDIIIRYKIKHIKTFKQLSNYIITNFAREFSYNKLKNILNLGSDHTIKNYIDYLQETYLIFIIEKFSYKQKETIIDNKKIYIIDNGLINSLAFKFREDKSHLYENLVAIELLKKNKKIYFYKTKNQYEIDFVIKEGIKIKQLIQVCYNLENKETKEREIRALLKAKEELKCNDLIILNKNIEKKEKNIKIIPLWKWLK